MADTPQFTRDELLMAANSLSAHAERLEENIAAALAEYANAFVKPEQEEAAERRALARRFIHAARGEG